MSDSSQNRPAGVPINQAGGWEDVKKSQDNTAKSQVMQQAQQILAATTQQQDQRK